MIKAAKTSQTPGNKIFDNWCGLIGFGVPINGLDAAGLRGAVRSQPNERLIKQVCLDEYGNPPSDLRSLASHFETCCKGKEINNVQFYETDISPIRRVHYDLRFRFVPQS